MTYPIQRKELPKKVDYKRRGRKAKYPLADLNVGESFLVTDKKITRGLLNTVIRQYREYNEQEQKRFQIHQEENGLRVARIRDQKIKKDDK